MTSTEYVDVTYVSTPPTPPAVQVIFCSQPLAGRRTNGTWEGEVEVTIRFSSLSENQLFGDIVKTQRVEQRRGKLFAATDRSHRLHGPDRGQMLCCDTGAWTDPGKSMLVRDIVCDLRQQVSEEFKLERFCILNNQAFERRKLLILLIRYDYLYFFTAPRHVTNNITPEDPDIAPRFRFTCLIQCHCPGCLGLAVSI